MTGEKTVKPDRGDIARDHLIASRQIIDFTLEEDGFVTPVHTIACLITAGSRTGNKLMFVGNGGSAADVHHTAAEFCIQVER
jgi:D-sedoheptulose 7-phosphate isomerase